MLRGLDALGLSVPEDVMVTGFDDIALSALPRLALTTVRQPVDAIAAAAVEMVRVATTTERLGVHRNMLQPELIARASTDRRA